MRAEKARALGRRTIDQERAFREVKAAARMGEFEILIEPDNRGYTKFDDVGRLMEDLKALGYGVEYDHYDSTLTISWKEEK